MIVQIGDWASVRMVPRRDSPPTQNLAKADGSISVCMHQLFGVSLLWQGARAHGAQACETSRVTERAISQECLLSSTHRWPQLRLPQLLLGSG